MTTSTTRYGLTKIQVGSDNVDVVADFNNNWDAIDQKLGTQVCTSSTRPASPIQGMQIFETDTGFTRVYKGAAWQSVGNAVGTSGARPANPIQGDDFYETDNTVMRSRGAAAWNGVLAVATSTALPANPIAGDFAYLSDKDCVVRYTGSAWRLTSIVACTSTTHPTLSLAAGTQIFETDTSLGAVYSGANFYYGLQQIAPTQSVSAAANIAFSGLPAVRRLLVCWRLRPSAGAQSLNMQIDSDTTAGHYQWSKTTGRAAAATATDHTVAGPTDRASVGVVAGTTANYYSSGEIWLNGWNATNGFCNISSESSAWDTSTSYWAEKYAALFSGSAAAHTALTLIPASGTVTGEVTVYGGP